MMDSTGPRVPGTTHAAAGVRRAFALTAVVASALLVATAWRARETSRGLAVTITRAQAEALRNDLGLRWPPHWGAASQRALDETLQADTDQGLRALAMVDDNGRVVRGAGVLTPVPVPVARGPSGPYGMRVGTRVRVIFPPMGPPGPPPGRGFPQRPPPEGMVGMPPPPPPEAMGGPPPWDHGPGGPPPPSRDAPDDTAAPLRLVMEFEPANARALHRQADQMLGASSAIAALLLAAAAWLWRMSLRAEAVDRRVAVQERLAALGTMSAVIAHEIRNPLASLKGNAQLLVEGLTAGSRERAQADRVVTAAGRLERLTRELVSFVGDGPPALARVDPVEIARSALTDLSAEVTVTVEGVPPRCLLDAGQVRMALTNLVDNALRASPTGVTVSVRTEDDTVQYRVRDHGPGIPAENLERIFEPFVTGRAQGAGLGLAIVRRVASRHGGTAWARNIPGGGAEFGLRLPVRTEAVPEGGG